MRTRRPAALRTAVFWIAIVAVLSVGTWILTQKDSPIETSLDLGAALGMNADLEGYTVATGPRAFAFPDDHGPHDDFKLEWWYFTGNLKNADGEHFGYQFTVFRSALAPPDSIATAGTSKWSTRQLYFAHFAVTDVEAGRYRSFEKFSRGAVGLAGATAAPFRVWVEDWSVGSAGDAGKDPGSIFPLRLHAAAEGIELALEIEPGKRMVLQGDAGFSRKGGSEGQASYYYSYTSLPTTGTVGTPSGSYTVSGSSWMDREWGTNLLGEDQVGWDWFSLQLDGAMELMFFRLRAPDGTSSWTDGLLVNADGTTTRFAADNVRLEVVDRWTSARTGATYPSTWRMQIPELGADLVVTPYIEDQEFTGTVTYWEGAVQVTGTLGDGQAAGSGYVELTGYEAREPTGAATRRGVRE